MTPLAATINLAVALMDVIFVVAAVQSMNGHPTTVVTSFDLTNVFVRVFPMLPAPLLFLSIGGVLFGSRLLPRAFGFLAVALGLAFAGLGFIGLFNETALGLTIVLQIGQEIWIVAAAIALVLARSRWAPVSIAESAVDQTATTT